MGELRLKLFVALFLLASVSADNIGACGPLNKANTRYEVTGDILQFMPQTCLTITAENVTLDCNGHLIDGNDVPNTYGILVNEFGATITGGCRITDFASGIKFANGGGAGQDADNGTVEDVVISSCNGAGVLVDTVEYISGDNVTVSVTDTDDARCIKITSSDHSVFTNGVCYGAAGYATDANYFVFAQNDRYTVLSGYNFSYYGGRGAVLGKPLPVIAFFNNSKDFNVSYSSFTDDNGMGQDEGAFGPAQYLTAIKMVDYAPNRVNLTNVKIHDNVFEKFTKAVFMDYDGMTNQDYVGAVNVSYNQVTGYTDSSDAIAFYFYPLYVSENVNFKPFVNTVFQENECTDLGKTRYCIKLFSQSNAVNFLGYGMESRDVVITGTRFDNSSGINFYQKSLPSWDMSVMWHSVAKDFAFKDNRATGPCDTAVYFDLNDAPNGSMWGLHDYGSNYSYCDSYGLLLRANSMTSYGVNVFEDSEIEGSNGGNNYNRISSSWIDFVNVSLTLGETSNDQSNITRKWKAWVRALQEGDQAFEMWVVNASNQFNVTVLNGSTNSTGWLGNFNLTEYNISTVLSTVVWSSDHYFNASAWGAGGVPDNTTNFYNVTQNYPYSNPITIYLQQPTIIDVTISGTSIEFGAVSPNTANSSATAGFPLVVTIHEATNVATDLSVNGSDLNSGGGDTLAVNNVTYCNESSGWKTELNATFSSGSDEAHAAYSNWVDIPDPAGDITRDIYWFVSVPAGQAKADYAGKIYVRVSEAG